MFDGASVFKQNLNDWDVSQVTDTRSMFSGATAFNAPLNAWNVAQVAAFTSMFSSAAAFNQDLSAWDVSAVPGNGNNADSLFYKTGMSNCNKKAIYDRFKAVSQLAVPADYTEIADASANDGEDWNTTPPSC